MKIPKLKSIKRMVSGLLATTMLLTTPLTALAGGTQGGSAQGNAGAGSIRGGGGDFSSDITDTYKSGKLGLRFSL